MLIDNNTLRWFDHHLNTIENLIQIKIEDFKKLKLFKDYDNDLKSVIFKDTDNDDLGAIQNLDILKIGSIKSKNTDLNIYNLKIQFLLTFDDSKTFEKEYKTFLYTIGNLNTQGIQ